MGSEDINVYITNPCDLLNRPDGYFTDLVASRLHSDGQIRTMNGLALVLAYLISLFWLVTGKLAEFMIFALACASPIGFYALARRSTALFAATPASP